MTPPIAGDAALRCVDSLDPATPGALAERMSLLLQGARGTSDGTVGAASHEFAGAALRDSRGSDGAVDALLDAGIDGLERMLRSGATTRDAALDLLAVDALVTYAFEIAVVDERSLSTLDALAAEAMMRIAALADVVSDGAPATP